jgi:DNA-binding NarL/FixJ family response regulator
MGGKVAVQKLLEIDPKVKTIVSSGYSMDPIMSSYQHYGFKGIVPKPYNAVELSKALPELTTENGD